MKNLTFAAIVVILVGVMSGCGAKQEEVRWVKGPMPANGNFDGVYQSDFGRLELTVQGDNVVGLYESDTFAGRIEGKVEDNLLFFEWTQWNQEMRGKDRETNGSGVFQFVIDQIPVGNKMTDYPKLEGWWGYEDTDLVNRWNATKLSDKAKKKLAPYKPSKGEMQQEESGSGVEEGAEPESEEPAESKEESSIDDVF